MQNKLDRLFLGYLMSVLYMLIRPGAYPYKVLHFVLLANIGPAHKISQGHKRSSLFRPTYSDREKSFIRLTSGLKLQI
jgi:hypothetical protein